MENDPVVLDLFAGTGWGVACQRLGIQEMGVEIMPEAVATRTANGMETIYHDVWEGILLDREAHELIYGSYGGLIASPPCQTYSLAGNGAGRAALAEVLEAIREKAYEDPAALRAFGEKHDPRTALVLTPLSYIHRDRPLFVILEQVPPVLPVWQAYAEVMRGWGYSVDVGVLHAEQYGVPQTRKRAILVARLDGPAKLPVPTHSRYHSRTPEKLDPGVLPWVSMAEALGWGMTARPYYTITAGASTPDNNHTGGPAPDGLGGAPARAAVRRELAEGRWLDGGHDVSPESWKGSGPNLKLSIPEAAILQSYPMGTTFTSNNRLAHQTRRPLDHPAPTITAGHDSSNRGFLDPEGHLTVATPDQVAALQSYPSHMAGSGTSCQLADPRPVTEPAQTITGAGNAEWGTRPTRAAGPNDRDPEGCRLTPAEAAALQTFPSVVAAVPAPFIWKGPKSKQYLQIGNAVPPLLAQAVLSSVLEGSRTPGEVDWALL